MGSVAAAAGVKGRTISLKLKRRKTNAPDPPKFMGHGDCDNMSRSLTLSRFTDAPADLAAQGRALLKALRVNPTQIRGIGLNVSFCCESLGHSSCASLGQHSSTACSNLLLDCTIAHHKNIARLDSTQCCSSCNSPCPGHTTAVLSRVLYIRTG